MIATCEHATAPEDLAPLSLEPANARDIAGPAEIHGTAVLAHPPNSSTVGPGAIRAAYGRRPERTPPFPLQEPLRAVRHGDLAPTSPRSVDGTGTGTGGRARGARRRPDGIRPRVTDRPGTVVAR